MVLDPARMEPEELEGRRDQDSKNRSIAPNPIWSNQEQDESFLFIYIHCLLYLLFSKVISINQSEDIPSNFTLFLVSLPVIAIIGIGAMRLFWKHNENPFSLISRHADYAISAR